MAAAIIELHSECSAAGADDYRLIESLKAGDERAYEELLARFQQAVYALSLRLLNDEGEASDVVQEVFLKVFRNIGTFRGQSSLKTWMYRITVNEAHNARRWFFRHRRREVELDTDPGDSRSWRETIADAGPSPFDKAFDHEQAAIIETALEQINPVFRSAVVLRDITDLSYDEIAEILGVSLGTVKSRILRGREALRAELLKGDPKQRRPWQLVPKTAE